MNYTDAKKFLARAEKRGYVAYHSGIVCEEDGRKKRYGINIDGDGYDGRYFGCPIIIWDKDHAEEKFPARRIKE